jgi:hypothetical protein
MLPTVWPFANCSTPMPTAPTDVMPRARWLCSRLTARFAVYMSGEGSEPTYVLEGREALSPVFADLNQYDVTTHFNGQSTVTLDGDTAAGECYTIAHHLYTADDERKIMIASLRSLDTYSKVDGAWYFAERKLIVDWMETRTSIAP